MSRPVKLFGALGILALLAFLVLALTSCEATGPSSLVGSYDYSASTGARQFEGRLHIDSIAEDGLYGWWEVDRFMQARQRLSPNGERLTLQATASDTSFVAVHLARRDGGSLSCEEVTLYRPPDDPLFGECSLRQ